MVESRPRYVMGYTAKIDSSLDACIMPFAQRDVIHTFMEGIDQFLQAVIETSTDKLFRGVIDSILKDVKNRDSRLGRRLEKSYRPKVDALLTELFEGWQIRRRTHYSGPIMSAVAALPKDELAAMAEALVNITKIRRRVSIQEESVGGPIDVAIITKGDGFVWVKRKHYFDASLNPRVIARYYKEDR